MMATPLKKTASVANLNIYDKYANFLADVHAAIDEGSMRPTGWNKYSEYPYWQLSDLVSPLTRFLKANGLLKLPMTADGVMATVHIVGVEGEGVIEIRFPLSSARLKAAHEVQNTGAVWSYTRRYVWLTIGEIPEADILDSGAAGEPTPKKGDPASEAQMEMLRGRIAAMPDSADKTNMIEWLDKTLEKGPLTVEKASAAIDRVLIKLRDHKEAEASE